MSELRKESLCSHRAVTPRRLFGSCDFGASEAACCALRQDEQLLWIAEHAMHAACLIFMGCPQDTSMVS